MNNPIFQRPFGSAYNLGVEQFYGIRESEFATVRYDGPNSVVVGNNTIHMLPELTTIQPERSSKIKSDAMEHKYCGRCAIALFSSWEYGICD